MKKYCLKYGLRAFLVIIILGLCIIHAVFAKYTVDFYPINGTFQSYNVVRRSIAGQIPYRDFACYLGIGHLYIGKLFTIIFGGDFAASLMAFSFLTIFSLCLLSVVIGKVILGNDNNIPYAVTILMLVWLMAEKLTVGKMGGISDCFINALNSSLTSGNSARQIRGMVVPLAIISLYLGARLITQKKIYSGKINKNISLLLLLSIISGLSFLWSNDFGIAWYLSTLFVLLYITLILTFSWKEKITILGVYLITSLITIFITVQIVTLGHFNNWAMSTFNTGGYQSWYYGTSDVRSYYLWNVDFSFVTILQAVFTSYYLWKIYINKKSESLLIRYAALATINMAGFAAINEYKLLSHGDSTEVAYIILFFTICYEGFNLINLKTKFYKPFTKIAIFVGVAAFISKTQARLILFEDNYRGTYVAELGGGLTTLFNDINLAKQFVGNKKIFSTYASALETVTNQYQPSGVDYIIHVLGDKARQNYLNCFGAADFEYTSTIREDYSELEPWMRHANWFFYRELYREYIPVWFNEYQTFWTKNTNQEGVTLKDTSVEIIKVDECRTIIKVVTNSNVNGIADILVKYDSLKDDSLSSKFIINQMVYVYDLTANSVRNSSYDGWTIRDSGIEYLPVTIINGVGEIMLTSEPARDTYLEVESAECSNIFTTKFDYLEVKEIIYINDETNKIIVPNNALNQISISGAKRIIVDDQAFFIKNIDISNDTITIILSGSNVEQINSLLLKNNVCKIEK